MTKTLAMDRRLSRKEKEAIELREKIRGLSEAIGAVISRRRADDMTVNSPSKWPRVAEASRALRELE